MKRKVVTLADGNKEQYGPTTGKQRHVVLDALRGLALMGIALAYFPEFALWTFLSESEQAIMPTREVDRVVRYLQYVFVDGKFYTICLLFNHSASFTFLAYTGRMALTNYISQSLIGILLFYGIGFGMGTSFGLVYVELIALAVFFQTFLSGLWLRYFRFGPLEWLWRMLTYGRYFKIL